MTQQEVNVICKIIMACFIGSHWIVFCLALVLDSIKNFSAQYDLSTPFNALPELKLQNYDKKTVKKVRDKLLTDI